MLILLARNPGRAVEKREILDTVWPDTFVIEDVLVQAVREIRRALEDDKDDPRYVQTVPRVGYRFVGEVTAPPSQPGPAAPASEATGPTLAPEAEPAVDRGPRRRWLAAVPVLVLVVVAWLATRALYREDAAHRSPVPSPTPAPLRQLTFGVGTAVKPAFSPDGRMLLYVSEPEETSGVLDLFVMPAEGGNSWRITDRLDPRGDLPVFTADGTAVVFSRYRSGERGSREADLWVVPAFGGTPRLLLAGASGAGFSPDGKRVAYTRHLGEHRVLLVSPVGALETQQQIASTGFTPRFSPDGRWLAYTTSNPEGGEGQLWVVDAVSLSGARPLTDRSEQVYGLAWTADSRELVFASSRTGPHHIWKVGFAGGPAAPLTAGVGEYFSPALSPDGRTLVFAHVRPARDVKLAADLDRSEVSTLTRDEYHYWPRLSPSGGQLASVTRQPDFAEHLLVTDLATRRRITVGERSARYPCWIDDERLAYLAAPAAGSGTEVRLVRLREGASRLLTSFEGSAEWLAVDANASRVATVRVATEGRRRLVLRDVASGRERTLAEGGDYEGLRFGHDGRLAWSGPHVAGGPDSNGIWVAGPDDAAPVRVADDGYGPAWSADGRSLYFTRAAGGGERTGLWRLDLPGGGPVRVRAWTQVSQFDVAGERLVFMQDGAAHAAVFGIALDR